MTDTSYMQPFRSVEGVALLHSTRTFLQRLLPILAIIIGTSSVCAAPALHDEIDRLVTAHSPGRATVASDGEFLRRVYLDLSARIPTASEARAFLADHSPGKRAALIDRLFVSPEYPQRMTELFTVMLMERRLGNDPAAGEWEKYLLASFTANKPLDQLAREILAPNADDSATRAAAIFYTKRLEHIGQNPVDHPRLTRDIGRLFLGKDFQCAQCHNHLFIKEYKQADFQGLFACVEQTYIRTDVKFPAVGEKVVDKKLEFMSVFATTKHQTGPHPPGCSEAEIPVFKKGEEYSRAPDKASGFPGTPKFSPLRVMADEIPASDAFARNFANRLWFCVMGRGLVSPLDQHHAANPPSNPELLDLLSSRLVEMKFDSKAFLRELVLSQSYQRSSLLPEEGEAPSPDSFLVANTKRLSAEQLAWSFLTATGEIQRFPATIEKISAVKGAEKSKTKPVTLADIHSRFANAFGNPAGEAEVEFAPSLAGALFVSNSDLVLDCLKPRPGNLIQRLLEMKTGDVADELYLSILSRRPDGAESADVAAYLAAHKDRAAALADLAWSLLASTEFCVNH